MPPAAAHDSHNAFIETWPEAEQSAATGPLAGWRVAVKDNICTRRGRTTCGSRMLENYRSPYDAHVVERLAAAGAVIAGKTNLDEFGMGSTSENSAFGPTRNPWDTQRVAGGSSGGSAAAVAARLVRAALGSDTGGSVRFPAAMCGVTGLKPTYGRVSRYGLVAYGSSFDCIGVLATSAADAAEMLYAIAGHDPRDATCVDQPVPDYMAMLHKRPGRLRIGVPREYFAAGLDADVKIAVEAALEVFRAAGANVVEIAMPLTDASVAAYYLIVAAEASSNLARFDGVHFGHRTASPRDYMDVYSASRSEGLGEEVKLRILLGTFALSSGYYDAWYRKAQQVRTLIRRDYLRAFEQCDVLAGPTAPFAAPLLGNLRADPLAMYLGDVYTVGANLAGIPAISIPCGFTAGGLPIGLQLQGPHFAEAQLLCAAHAYQQATDWHQRCP